MALADIGIRVGAAAFALGVALAGPQAAGVAAADRGDAEGTSSSARADRGTRSAPDVSAPASGHGSVPARQTRRGMASRHQVSADKPGPADAEPPARDVPAAEPPAAEPAPVRVETESETESTPGDQAGPGQVDEPPGTPAAAGSGTEPTVFVDHEALEPAAVPVTADTEAPPDAAADTSETSGAPEAGDAAVLPVRGRPDPLPWWRTTTGSVTGSVPDGAEALPAQPDVADDAGSVDEPVWSYPAGPADDPAAGPTGESPTLFAPAAGQVGNLDRFANPNRVGNHDTLQYRIVAVIDRVLDWLNGLPVNPLTPLTDFVSGALLLLRRILVPPVPTVVDMAFVTVGDAGNKGDARVDDAGRTGFGAVDYQYRIGTYEVTIGQYTAFLNAVAADDPYGLYSQRMEQDRLTAGIFRAGSPGSYTYSVIPPAGRTPPGADSPADRPVTYVSWYSAARFANWMHNGQGSGSTETGAYTISTGVVTAASRTNNVNTYTLASPSTLSVGDQVTVTGLKGSPDGGSGAGFNITGIVTSVSELQFTVARTEADATATGPQAGSMTGASPTAAAGALYRLPTENEWYKAAYYSPQLNSGSGGYYYYATRSDDLPGNRIGSSANQANFHANGFSVTQSPSFDSNQNYLTNVGAFTDSASYYGTFDQSGNAFEWTETIVSVPAFTSFCVRRGGEWYSDSRVMESSFQDGRWPSFTWNDSGFRLASPA